MKIPLLYHTTLLGIYHSPLTYLCCPKGYTVEPPNGQVGAWTLVSFLSKGLFFYRSTGRNNGVKQYGNIYALIESGLCFGHMMTSMK